MILHFTVKVFTNGIVLNDHTANLQPKLLWHTTFLHYQGLQRGQSVACQTRGLVKFKESNLNKDRGKIYLLM